MRDAAQGTSEPVEHREPDRITRDAGCIDLEALKEIKEVRRGRIADYLEFRPAARFVTGASIWEVPCAIALPCARQNELDGGDALTLARNGCSIVAEGANMPCSPDAVKVFAEAGVTFAPGKAANAGGVATSGLERQRSAAPPAMRGRSSTRSRGSARSERDHDAGRPQPSLRRTISVIHTGAKGEVQPGGVG
ncbi:hypothetical protein QFZ52_001655 [Arthrobacter woluwensis]|uniref:hypothetical protein n=1 Tax=Arthrobacter woluwensis TaxID=156980 RepID=UPI002787FFC8|nr:hypothetical protein [Arthrobacter woluwensis]